MVSFILIFIDTISLVLMTSTSKFQLSIQPHLCHTYYLSFYTYIHMLSNLPFLLYVLISLSMMLDLSFFLIDELYLNKMVHFYFNFIENLYHERVMDFVKCFHSPIGIIMWRFPLNFINMAYCINWSLDVRATVHSWDKSHLGFIILYNIFYILLTWFAIVSLRIFISRFEKEIGL